MDTKLTFSKHIDTTVSKANKVMGLIMRSMQTGYKVKTFSWKLIFNSILW